MKVIQLHQEEKQLILLAVENNRQAQQQIYTTFSPKMLGVCRQYIKDLHLAEDVMITGFMKVFTHIKNFEHKGSFEGWIRRIMICECIDFLRVKKNFFIHTDLEFFDCSDHEQVDDFDDSLNDAIQNLIDNLPNGYKMVFNLYAIEGYKHHEIAALLKISEGTSKSQLAKARLVLKQQISELKNKIHGAK